MKNEKDSCASKCFSFVAKSITACVIEVKNGEPTRRGKRVCQRRYLRLFPRVPVSRRWVPFSKSNVAVLIPPRLLPRANRSSRDITWEIDAASNGARRVFRPCLRRYVDISAGPRHRVDAQVPVVVELRSSTRDFSRLRIDDLFHNRAKRDVLEPVSLSFKDTDRRLRRTEFLFAFKHSRVFCVSIFFSCLERDKNTAADSPWRSHARSGLEFPRRLRKSLYRKQDHASVSAPGFPFARDGRSGNAVLSFHCSVPFLSAEPPRSHRSKAS